MLRRALKTLKHGLEHLKQGSASDRGFAFEHVDQAAELLVKEKARQLGETIYRRGTNPFRCMRPNENWTRGALIFNLGRLWKLYGSSGIASITMDMSPMRTRRKST